MCSWSAKHKTCFPKKPSVVDFNIWNPYIVNVYGVHCWFRKWSQPPFGICFPRNQSLLVHGTNRWDKLRQIQQVIITIPFLNLLSAFTRQNHSILNSRIKVPASSSSSRLERALTMTMLFSRGMSYKLFLNMAFFKLFFYSFKSPMPKNHMKQALKKKTKYSFVQIKGVSVITFEHFMLAKWTEE